MSDVIKVTARSGRATAGGDVYNADHNCRASGVGSHVDRERMSRNRYLVWDGADTRPLADGEGFRAFELSRYADLFSASLDAQNARYLARSQYERVKSVRDYYRSERSCPEEYVLQIGKDGACGARDFKRSINAFLTEFERRYSGHIIPLDIALHFDETSPHAHFRYVYVADGKDGAEVSQKRALAALGIERPALDAPESRYNNRKVAFSSQMRELWADCVERETDYVVNRVPDAVSRGHVEVAQYRAEQSLRDVASEVDSLRSERDSLIAEVSAARDELRRTRGVLVPLRAAAARVSDMLERFSSVPAVACIRDALDEFARAYDVASEVDDVR